MSLVEPGRLLRAPESFLDASFVDAVQREGFNEERRNWMRRAFTAAAATLAGAALVERAPAADAIGDPDILNLPAWSTSLGNPVAQRPYGMPSKHESNLQRR